MSDIANKNHIRYQRLNQVVKKALEESMKALSDDNLQMCYPSLSNTKEGKNTINAVKDQLLESWSVNSQKEFDAIYEEREIQAKLDELDDLIIEAQERRQSGDEKEIPIDQKTPVNVVNSHLIPVKEANLKNLEKQLEDLRNSNKNLLDQLSDLSKEANEIQTDVADKFTSLNKFNDLVSVSNFKERLNNLINVVSTEEKEQLV